MSDLLPEEQYFFDLAVERLSDTRRTFTERDALASAWVAGYGLNLEYDERFIKAQPRHSQYDPHYRLREHILANQRLFNDLLAEAWDGRDLDSRLRDLDASEGGHHIFYPHDPRLFQNRQGRWEASVEKNVTLTAAQKRELDTFLDRLLAAWAETGGQPWTVAHIIVWLKELGWSGAERPDAVRLVRAWLLATVKITRVGLDYWLPEEQLPASVTRTRLQVSPLRSLEVSSDQITSSEDRAPSVSSGEPERAGADEPQTPRREQVILFSGEATRPVATFLTAPLRTVNLLEGFVSIPSSVREVYPPIAPGTTRQTLLDAVWYEDSEHFWLWLDRQQHRLYGPGLLSKIEWSSPGDILRVQWAPDVLILTVAGHDEQVQREETRLIDVESLKELRGGSGESYRRAIQRILLAAPEGLRWREVAEALSQRQQHIVHRGTVLALLYQGGFVQRNHRWFAASDSAASRRSLRRAMTETLVSPQAETETRPLAPNVYTRTRATAIHQRLTELSKLL